jgi:hypothetical protein
MRLRFISTSRTHKIGKAHALSAIAQAGDPVLLPNGDLEWLADDDRGVELHIVGFPASEDPDLILIKHVFPTALRGKK